MIGFKRKHPDVDCHSDPSPKRWKCDQYFYDDISPPPYRRKKYRAKRSKVITQVFDLGQDVRLVQKIYHGLRTFF